MWCLNTIIAMNKRNPKGRVGGRVKSVVVDKKLSNLELDRRRARTGPVR